MNNTKTLTAIAAILIAATLVVGTLATTQSTQSAFAYPQKKRGQDDSKNGNTVTNQACKQRGSVSGFDNTAEQECENLICTHPGNNATCSQEGVVTPTTTTTPPVKLTCEQCIRKFLNTDQINDLISIAGPSNPTLGQVCDILHTGTQANIQALFVSILGRGSESVAAQIIQCLLNAGIVFATDTGG
jgi:hypothetical protein